MNSPCTKVCAMDADNRYCLGCQRTLDEIASWGVMDDGERAAIVAQLAARRATSSSPSEIAEVPAAPLA
jgi:uncharacterized protein